jgi:hypothetical protein
MSQIQANTAAALTANKKLKLLQLQSMVRVSGYQRMKENLARTLETQNCLLALQNSLPVIENLIANSSEMQGFEIALQLIAQMNQITDTKLAGLKLQETYSNRLHDLMDRSCGKIEGIQLEKVKRWLDSILGRGEGTKTVTFLGGELELHGWVINELEFASAGDVFGISTLFLDADNRRLIMAQVKRGSFDLVSQVSNTLGDNTDNLIRSLKQAIME